MVTVETGGELGQLLLVGWEGWWLGAGPGDQGSSLGFQPLLLELGGSLYSPFLASGTLFSV